MNRNKFVFIYSFMQQCMLGVLYYSRSQNALWHETFDCHHCWDSYADCWCLCVSKV